MTVSAVVSDLDGTLWARDMSVHAETHRTIAAIDDAAIPLLIATGRRGLGALKGLTPAGLANRPGVLMNGALARDDLSGESFLRELIEPTDSIAVMEAFSSADLEPLVYIDHPTADLVIGAAPAAGADYLDSAPGVRVSEDLSGELPTLPTIGFGAFGFGLDRLQPVADTINGSGVATAIIGESLLEGGYGLMVQGAGIDKITAIRSWCARRGVDVDNLAVLGDGANDIDMLKAARIAIVPSNAPEEIRALATHVADPAEDGGWAIVREILDIT